VGKKAVNLLISCHDIRCPGRNNFGVRGVHEVDCLTEVVMEGETVYEYFAIGKGNKVHKYGTDVHEESIEIEIYLVELHHTS
jgi:hypothetical protein